MKCAVSSQKSHERICIFFGFQIQIMSVFKCYTKNKTKQPGKIKCTLIWLVKNEANYYETPSLLLCTSV